jgi:LL-diaminopimelate aminotransferase
VQFSTRMDKLPPYLFAEIERKISEKRKAGVDVISLGIGDPDLGTPDYIVREMQRQLADPRNHHYPTNWGVSEFAQAASAFYARRFGVEIDPEREFFPALGSKEGLAHICWSCLDAGDLVLVPDPAYPVYSASSMLLGADIRYMPLTAENGFLPDLDDISPEEARRAKLLFIGYPNNPTAGIVEEGSDFFARVVAFA